MDKFLIAFKNPYHGKPIIDKSPLLWEVKYLHGRPLDWKGRGISQKLAQ